MRSARFAAGTGWELTGGARRTLHAGVSSYDISLEKQEVLVKGTIGYDDLHAKIAKTGKQVCPLSRFRETRCRASVRRRLTGVARSSPARRLNEGANLLDGYALRSVSGGKRLRM